MSYFKAEMHQFDFGWRSAQDSAGGTYSAPPDPWAGFKGAYFGMIVVYMSNPFQYSWTV